VEEYNNGVKSARRGLRPERFERGSYMQKIYDPFAGAYKDENGSWVYEVEERELVGYRLNDEEHLRQLFEKRKEGNEAAWEIDPEEENFEFKQKLFEELQNDQTPFNAKDFQDVFDREISVFKEGEKYDFVKDLKNAYQDSLRLTTEQKIVRNLPDHVFWDIKKPLN